MLPLTSIMYHYVRARPDRRFPQLRGLAVEEFDAQLDHLCSRYTIVSMEAVVDAIEGSADLPPNAAMLSFDDGYIDHYKHVFPRLKERGLSGAFYPPRRAVTERRLLDVNKIQFILASGADPAKIAASIMVACRDLGSNFVPGTVDSYDYSHPYDPKEVSFVKLMLGRELPDDIRYEVTDRLFATFVTADEAGFADTLYVSESHLSEMVSEGMHVGSHGDAHVWLNKLPLADQIADIERSLDMLERVGAPAAYRTFCYPYGGYNLDTLVAMNELGFKAAVTASSRTTPIGDSPRFEIPRFDTNDFPKTPTRDQ